MCNRFARTGGTMYRYLSGLTALVYNIEYFPLLVFICRHFQKAFYSGALLLFSFQFSPTSIMPALSVDARLAFETACRDRCRLCRCSLLSRKWWNARLDFSVWLILIFLLFVHQYSSSLRPPLRQQHWSCLAQMVNNLESPWRSPRQPNQPTYGSTQWRRWASREGRQR